MNHTSSTAGEGTPDVASSGVLGGSAPSAGSTPPLSTPPRPTAGRPGDAESESDPVSPIPGSPGQTRLPASSSEHRDNLVEMQRQFEILQRAFARLKGHCDLEIEHLSIERQALHRREANSMARLEVHRSTSSPPVRVNVGGEVFTVGEATLRQHAGSLLDVILSGDFPVERDESGSIFIDRDPELFREILHYLRTGDAKLGDSSTMRRRLLGEARFYGLDMLVAELQSVRGTWQSMTSSNGLVRGSTPSPRCFASCHFIGNNRILVFGGCTANDVFFDSLYEVVAHDDVAGARQTSIDAGAVGEASCVLRDSVGVGAAASAAEDPPRPSSALALEASGTLGPSPEVLSWREINFVGGAPPASRSGHATVLMEGFLLVFYGNDSQAMVDDVVAIDTVIARESTTRCARLQQLGETVQPRSGHSVCSRGNLVYLFGGKQIFPHMAVFGDLYEGTVDLDAMTITWKQMDPVIDPIPSAQAGSSGTPNPTASSGNSSSAPGSTGSICKRAYHTAVMYKDCMYVYGGIVNDVYSRDVCEYNVVTNEWTTLQEGSPAGYIPSKPRSGHIAMVHGSEMLVIGSYSEEGLYMMVDALHLETFRWRRVATQKRGPGKRAAPSAAVLPLNKDFGRLPRLFVFGGFDIAARRCFDDTFLLAL